MIKITSGKYRGRYLKLPDTKNTRPTMEKVRQAIFSALKDRCINAVCLDLFAGSGAMGLEALSRGAKRVYFNDKDASVFKVLKENVSSIEEDDQAYKLFKCDFRLFLKKDFDETFDIVFLDPPYRFDVNADVIREMEKRNLLSDDALIVSEQNFKNKEIENFDMKEYKYGEKYVALYRRKEI